MALAATGIAEVRPLGSDTLNGGVFDPGQTAGMNTDGAATLATGTAPVFSSASYNFVAGDVGAKVFVGLGTNWTPGWYPIASVSAGAATLNAAAGAAVLKTGLVPSTAAGCATVASPTGATWAIDYSQQDAAQYAYTDLASAGAGLTVSSAAKPFGKEQVGNSLVITGGTNFTAGRYVIASVAAAVATVVGAGNITSGAGASGTGGQGGGLASPGAWMAFRVAGNQCFVKNGTTYAVGTGTANTAGNRLDFNVTGSQTAFNRMLGYATVRGDNGRFVMSVAAGFTGTQVVNFNNVNPFNELANFELLGVSVASGAAALVVNGQKNRCRNFKASGFVGGGGTDIVTVGNNGSLFDFEISGGTTGANRALTVSSATAYIDNGDIHGNAGKGVEFANNSYAVARRIRSYGHTGANGFGFSLTGNIETVLDECDAWGNAQANYILANANATLICYECGSVNSGGYGWDNRSAPDALVLVRCFDYNNTSGVYPLRPNTLASHQTLTGAPYTDPANGDFRLNATAGAGAQARGLAYLTLPGFTSYPDAGSMQHQDTGGGGGGSTLGRGIPSINMHGR